MKDLTIKSIKDKYLSKGIAIIDGNDNDSIASFACRDAYYDAMEILGSDISIGHALCIVGLRRTGKSVILEQIKHSSERIGIERENVLHLTLSAISADGTVSRDDLDFGKLFNRYKYPLLSDIQALIYDWMDIKKVKLVIIDEITLCEDLILCGKGLFDALFGNGVKVVLAGTESASFLFAKDNSLYGRICTIDVSYIPFGEYCRVKKLDTSTYEAKRRALDKYIQHGNILDDTVRVDDQFIESAVGVNLALSIINSDNTFFLQYEHSMKDLVQSIIKYFKLLEEKISLPAVNKEISRAILSEALNNINRKHSDKIELSKNDRKYVSVESAQNFFKKYELQFDVSEIKLTQEQLEVIDETFSKMALLYSLTRIPYIKHGEALASDDVHLIHGILYNMGLQIVSDLKGGITDLSDMEVEKLADCVESTMYGIILENIVALQYIKQRELDNELVSQMTYYTDDFSAERKGTRFFLYKYRKKIYSDCGASEIDLVRNLDDDIELIEIKKNTHIDTGQTRWLSDNAVAEDIKRIIGDKSIGKRAVYYLGEPKTHNGIVYENIPEVLIEQYNSHFNKSVHD